MCSIPHGKSDEQVDSTFRGSFHVGRHATDLDSIKQFDRWDTHDIHGHLAGYHANPRHAGLGIHGTQLVDMLLTHSPLHQLGTHSGEVDLREGQVVHSLRQHHAEHPAHEILLHLACFAGPQYGET